MKGNEGLNGQKLENGAGPGAAKFFVWDLGTAGSFWQLAGRAPRSEARSCDGYPPEGSKSRKEQKDTPLKAQKDANSQRTPLLKARSGKRDAPKAKMEAEKRK